LNYKVLPPSVVDANLVDLEKAPSVNELSVTSGITMVEPIEGVGKDLPAGEVVMMKVRGWAFSGGGRNVVRVDVTGDRAKSWISADLLDGNEQRYGRSWAWTFWETKVPAQVQDDGSVHIYCKAVSPSLLLSMMKTTGGINSQHRSFPFHCLSTPKKYREIRSIRLSIHSQRVPRTPGTFVALSTIHGTNVSLCSTGRKRRAGYQMEVVL
jgi:hypothetical protein